MNTRLQVEHPVTEMISGKDLVREQILLAEGKPLSFAQDDLKINGHALEVRVYAEDPSNNFLPDIGTLETYQRPQGPGIRVDDGFEEGMKIPIYYDPMIAKLITHAENRTAAIEKMVRAIDDYKIVGIQTTLEFCKFAITHEAFVSGAFDTKFVENYFDPSVLEEQFSDSELELLSALAVEFYTKSNSQNSVLNQAGQKTESAWRNRLK